MCPQPDRKTVQIPQCGTKQPNFTRTVAGEEIAMLLVHAPGPYSDVPQISPATMLMVRARTTTLKKNAKTLWASTTRLKLWSSICTSET
jgi:hypothetical protein